MVAGKYGQAGVARAAWAHAIGFANFVPRFVDWLTHVWHRVCARVAGAGASLGGKGGEGGGDGGDGGGGGQSTRVLVPCVRRPTRSRSMISVDVNIALAASVG